MLPDGRALDAGGGRDWTVVDPETGESTPIGVEYGGTFNRVLSSWYFIVWKDNRPRLMRLKAA